jgi:hypothetical protein
MTITEHVWMTRQAHTRLESELAALRSPPSIEVPDDLMDYDGNLATHLARQTRICQIRDLLTNANVGEDPLDDGIAEANHLKHPGLVAGCAVVDFAAAAWPECLSPRSSRRLSF